VCLKAFVDSSGAADGAAPRVALARTRAGSARSVRVPFTLTDPAFSSGSAVVRLWLRDARGNAVRMIRIPAVSVNERESWRFTAPRRRGDYRIIARAWDVSGHRPAFTSAVLEVR
jgi:hypothetical protein